MKYIKSYEAKKIKNELADSIKKELKKFLNKYRRHLDIAIFTNKPLKEGKYPISIWIGGRIDKYEKSVEYKVLKKEMKKLGVKYFIDYDLTQEQAEQFLEDLKNKLPIKVLEIEFDTKKYNL